MDLSFNWSCHALNPRHLSFTMSLFFACVKKMSWFCPILVGGCKHSPLQICHGLGVAATCFSIDMADLAPRHPAAAFPCPRSQVQKRLGVLGLLFLPPNSTVGRVEDQFPQWANSRCHGNVREKVPSKTETPPDTVAVEQTLRVI